MNQQEMFDTVTRHLATLPHQAADANGCSYLTDDGLKCAIGCMIPDGHPGQDSSSSVPTLISYYPDLIGVCVPDDYATNKSSRDLAMRLQELHDMVSSWDNTGFIGYDALESTALHYNLTFTDPR